MLGQKPFIGNRHPGFYLDKYGNVTNTIPMNLHLLLQCLYWFYAMILYLHDLTISIIQNDCHEIKIATVIGDSNNFTVQNEWRL